MVERVTVDIEGIDEYVRNAEKLAGRYGETRNNPLFKETRQFINPLKNKVRAATPVDKGILKKTVKAEVRFSKRTGAIIGQVGWFFKGRYSKEYGRLIRARIIERDTNLIKRLARTHENEFRRRLVKVTVEEANKVIGR